MKKIIIITCLVLILGNTWGCGPRARVLGDLQQIEEMEAFESFSGFRVEEGRFYFTALEEGELNVYSIDLSRREVRKLFTQIDQYDSFIPLEGLGAVYVDQEGNLFHKNEEEETKIDENISGQESPNVIVALNRRGLLYTKGTNENSSLYLYMFETAEPQLVVENISEESFRDFHFITQWAPTGNYFIFGNILYNEDGENIANINATSTKWAPNSQYIAYIAMPENKEEQTIIIGDWTTYIGEKLNLFNVETKESEILLENPDGLIDPFDSMQWSRDSRKVAMLEGEIIIQQGALERVEYDRIRVYDTRRQEIYEIENVDTNFYEFIFNDLIYTKKLGVAGPLELLPVDDGDRRVFPEPIILNNRSMFAIKRDNRSYLIDGRALIEVDSRGRDRTLIDLPWEPLAMYFDETNSRLVIINTAFEMYLLSV